MASSETITSSEFIRHHLTNLTFGRHADGHWGMAHTGEEAANMGFMAVHVDSLFWSFVHEFNDPLAEVLHHAGFAGCYLYGYTAK